MKCHYKCSQIILIKVSYLTLFSFFITFPNGGVILAALCSYLIFNVVKAGTTYKLSVCYLYLNTYTVNYLLISVKSLYDLKLNPNFRFITKV